jgi:membrane protein YqaA with SNARE-associated domain
MSVPSPVESPDLRQLLRKHLLGAALSLIAIVFVAVLLTLKYRAELDAFTITVFDSIGIGGVVALLFITDAVVSPFPPDSVLILIAASPYHEHWLWLLPLLGVVSSLAGCTGYGIGRLLSSKPWAQRYFGSVHHRNEKLVSTYGPWAVALGALTPVPFSITCWTAGLLRLRFAEFILPCLLRVPRYMGYYAAIAYFPKLFG